MYYLRLAELIEEFSDEMNATTIYLRVKCRFVLGFKVRMLGAQTIYQGE